MTIRNLIITIICGASLSMATAAELEEEFMNPPDTARLWLYWTQSGHHDLESATADLEAMKKAGVGGVLRMDCSVGQVPGGTPFLGEQWRKQFVHSVHECERLGMEYTTITGPGWTGTGGPWISAEQSMQHLVPVTVATTGPAKFNQVLPLPQPKVSRYHRDQTPAMQKQIAEFYQDVALFAVPTRTPIVTDIAEKALHIRNPFTSMKGVRPYLPSPADHPAASEEQVINPKSIIDLTGKLDADGRLVWDVPEGDWCFGTVPICFSLSLSLSRSLSLSLSRDPCSDHCLDHRRIALENQGRDEQSCIWANRKSPEKPGSTRNHSQTGEKQR